MNLQERLADEMSRHDRVPTDNGFIGCACGWLPNEPRKWSKKQLAAQVDSDQPDPVDPEGDYDIDPEHASDEPWLAHVAATQAAIMESATND